MGVSVIVHTLNEEKNIANCLESVKWADEILVVDMHSSDRTREIAGKFTDRILLHPPMRYVEPARQFALEQVSHEWVLVVDADELVPRALRDELLRIAASGKADAVEIPHRNFFFGHEMRGAEWGSTQDYHIRFFRRSAMRYGSEIHEAPKLQAETRLYRISDASSAFVHFAYVDVEHFFEKTNRYTTIAAEGQGPLQEAPSSLSILSECWREFYWRYIKRKGYQDGVQGLCLSVFMVSYRLMILQKRLLMGRYNSKIPREAIANEYQRVANQLISEY